MPERNITSRAARPFERTKGPTGGGPPRGRRLRSPTPVADTPLYEKRLARTRTRSQSTTHPKGPTTRLTAPAYWKFESIPLQRRVHKLSVPVFAPGALKKPFPRPEHLRALLKTGRKAETPERARKLDPTRPRAGCRQS